TGRDLAAYRDAAVRACNELGLVPVAMEFWEAMGVGATAGSLAKLATCQAFIGLIAQRYGYVEDGYAKSVTELEFDRAADLGLPQLCFLIDPRFPWPPDQIDFDQMAL